MAGVNRESFIRQVARVRERLISVNLKRISQSQSLTALATLF